MSTKHDVRRMAEEIVAREGAFVNDPDDPGGATKYGVTIHTLRNIPWGDLDGDGDIDVMDVRALSQDHAILIFEERYFFGPRIDELPEALQATVFDMYVNAGANAVKLLQRLLCEMAPPEIAVDGVIGPQTIAAANRAWERAGDRLVDAYGIERRNFYFRIADRRPASRKYARTRAGGKGGWIKRAEEFISPEYHMTDAQFQARVAAWG
ncbi:holin-associated N-acetylmuramidase [uncultured Mameliella sp.]|uniref:holin-associated N-acetylmuramidase n=1 Tax=uncultured Mameliella sp. TaxID=1447087 RepID=UPI002611C75A|nr:holin-associated N-acetylmuramidase [uncultured Mameliella sp.]